MRANLIQGNALKIPLADGTVQTVVTSPPYFGLRLYSGGDKQLGLEPTLAEYIENMVSVFAEVWRVLRDDGTVWLNMGDSYNGSGKGGQSEQKRSENWQPTYGKKGYTEIGMKPKDLMMVPHRLAIALQDWGWWVRSDIVWAKPNPMPESVRDRPTKAHEYIFLLSKSKKYYYDADAIREDAQDWGTRDRTNYRSGTEDPKLKQHGMTDINFATRGRNRRTVWEITTKPYSGAHFATFPPEIPEICIKAGSKEGDIILDPFNGSGTTVMVAQQLGRIGVGVDLSWDYLQLSRERTGMAQMDEWQNGKKAEAANLEGLPMFK